MEKETQMYPNIYKFLDNNGFKIRKNDMGLITFEFKSSEIRTVFDRFRELMVQGDNETNESLSDNFYNQAWELRTALEMKYFPKLEVVLDSLNNFYKTRNTELDFMIVLDSSIIQVLDLGYNLVYLEMSSDKELFISKVHQELLDFDNFLERY